MTIFFEDSKTESSSASQIFWRMLEKQASRRLFGQSNIKISFQNLDKVLC